jgi:hypothetical protein
MRVQAVTVHRLTVNCTVVRDHPNIERVRLRLDDVAGRWLRQALEELLTPLAAIRSDEVLIIRRLELSLDLDISRALPDLARRWAARLVAQLAKAMSEGSRTEGLLRFSDPAHFLSRFLVDAAAGHASSKWYYRSFQGLAPLAISSALRTAVLEEPRRGLCALGLLAPPELASVLQALSSVEARRVMETVAIGGNDDAELEHAAKALIAVAPTWRALSLGVASPWISAVALLALASVESISPLPPVARVATSVAHWIAERVPGSPTRLLGEVQTELPAISALSSQRRAELATAFEKDQSVTGAAPESVAAFTPFGGLVLLLPHLAALPIDEIWTEPCERAWARMLVLSRCAGAGRAGRALADPLLQRLCGLRNRDPVLSLEEWVAKSADRLSNAFAPALWKKAEDTASWIRLTIGRDRNKTLVVHVAEPEGYWLGLDPLGPLLRAALRSQGDLRLASARVVTSVVSYLSSADWTLPPVADRVLTVAAQHVLRAFARRLPRFSESSPAYLYENFLAFSATVERIGERWVCRIGRPPLAALLMMTGALRGRITAPWLEPLELYSGG